MSEYIADPAEIPPHARTREAPHGDIWQRGNMRRFEAVPGRHAELVVLLGLSGEGRYLLDGDVLHLGRGSLVWALAGQSHMLLSQSAGFDMWVTLVHPRLWVSEASERPPMRHGDVPPPGLRQIDGTDLGELESLAHAISDTTSPEARGLGLRWWLLRAYQALKRAEIRGRARGLHDAVARAAHLIRAEPDLDLAQVARQSGLSESRLRRVFRREMGTSPHAFRTEQRLERADACMARGASLTEAALDAGFGSYTQFFRSFRAVRGMSPRDWYRIRTK